MNGILPVPRSLTASTIDAARSALQRIARQAVPAVADFCLVHLVFGRTIRCVAAAHATRPGARAVRGLMTHRIRRDDRHSTVAHVVRSRRVLVRTDIHPDADGAGAGSIAELHRRLAPTSALVVPIVHGDAVLGALSLCYAHSRRSYGARQIPAATRLASSIADVLLPPPPALAAAPGARRRLSARN